MTALLPLLACLPLTAQDTDARKKFAGTWEAKFKDKVICTIRVKVQGDTLNFEEKDGDDVLKFEMKVVGDERAELRIWNSPVPIKPIHFTRK